MFKALIFFIILNPVMAYKQIRYGHNLSPTTETLKTGKFTAGFAAVTLGVTDNLTVGTSPWIAWDYNMINLAVRWKHKIDPQNTIGLQTHYFNTYNEDKKRFERTTYSMHAISQFFTYSYRLAKQTNLILNINPMYFFDEEVPFSLRRSGATEDSYQINSTALLQTRILPWFTTNIELGVLGANYTYPQMITGLSGTFFIGQSFLFQLGFNITAVPRAMFGSQGVDSNSTVRSFRTFFKQDLQIDRSAHPEIQIEYFF